MSANKTERAAASQLQLVRLACQAGNIEVAAQVTEMLVGIYADTSKPVYAADKAKSALSALLRARMYLTSMSLMLSMIQWFAALSQPHNVAKMVLSRIILLLADGEITGAKRELNIATSMEGFVTSAECEAAELLIAAVENGDSQAAESTAKLSCVTSLDNQVCRVAQTALLGPSGERTAAAASAQSAALSTRLQQAGAAVPTEHTATAIDEPTTSMVLSDRAELFSAPVAAAGATSNAPGATEPAGEDELL